MRISRFIGCPGHGKCIVDGVNGRTKSKLTDLTASARLPPDDERNITRKHMTPLTMIDAGPKINNREITW